MSNQQMEKLWKNMINELMKLDPKMGALLAAMVYGILNDDESLTIPMIRKIMKQLYNKKYKYGDIKPLLEELMQKDIVKCDNGFYRIDRQWFYLLCQLNDVSKALNQELTV